MNARGLTTNRRRILCGGVAGASVVLGLSRIECLSWGRDGVRGSAVGILVSIAVSVMVRPLIPVTSIQEGSLEVELRKQLFIASRKFFVCQS